MKITLKNAYYNIIKKKSGLFIFTLILITMIALFGIANLDIDDGLTVLLPKDKELTKAQDAIVDLKKEFISDNMVFVSISGNPFSMDKIKKLYDLCREIDKLVVVKSTLHPFNSIYFKKLDNTFIIQKTSGYPKTQDELDKLLVDITSNRFLVGSAISYDHKSAGIVVNINTEALMGKNEKNNPYEIITSFLFGRNYGEKPIDNSYFCGKLEEVLKKYENDFTIHYAGMPVYAAKIKTTLLRDMLTLLIPAIILMMLTLFLTTWTKSGAFLPMISMLIGLVWTMGVLSWLRYKLNIIGLLMPPIILTIGSSYALHYLYAYYENANKYASDRISHVIKTSKIIFPTILMAVICTAVGFGSFFFATIDAIKAFGLFIIISLFFNFILTFFLLPTTLIKLDTKVEKSIVKTRNDIFAKFLRLINGLVYPLRWLWIGVFISSFIIFGLLVGNLKVETNVANFFGEKDKVKESLVYLQDNFGGTTNYYVTLRAKNNEKNFFKSRDGLLSAQKIQKYFDNSNDILINGFTMIGWNISLITILEDFNYNINGVRDIPQDEKQIKLFLSYLKASGNDNLKFSTNKDFSAITFQIRAKTNNAKEKGLMTEQELHKLALKLEKDLDKIAKEDGTYTVRVWGDIIILANISKYLIKDQKISIAISFILVFFIALFLFKSVYYAFLSSTSHTFGILMNFIVMSAFHIPLDGGTMMISAITIGVGVDSAIHFILSFTKETKKGLTTKEAILNTLQFSSRPILFSGIALFFGFLIFALSSFRPIFFFGVLISFAMFTCTFANLLILPSLLMVTEKIRKFFHKNETITH